MYGFHNIQKSTIASLGETLHVTEGLYTHLRTTVYMLQIPGEV